MTTYTLAQTTWSCKYHILARGLGDCLSLRSRQPTPSTHDAVGRYGSERRVFSSYQSLQQKKPQLSGFSYWRALGDSNARPTA